MQIDIGFSDVVTPEPVLVNYPTVLDQPSPQLSAYNRETAVAEKFEAMVKLGELNSRMKDFFDVMQLANTYDFAGDLLTDAIRKTFTQRQTEVELEPTCFTRNFAHNPTKQQQWAAFVRRAALTGASSNFSDIAEAVRNFLQPPAAAVRNSESFQARWVAATQQWK
jgi:hypothetical protein